MYSILRDDDGTYHFRCAGCDAEGILEVSPAERGQIGCPEGCGASYVQVRLNKRQHLVCVVQPIFVEENDEEDTPDA
jgi:hypothetical protein